MPDGAADAAVDLALAQLLFGIDRHSLCQENVASFLLMNRKHTTVNTAQMMNTMMPMTAAILQLYCSWVRRNSQVTSRSTSLALEEAMAWSAVTQTSWVSRQMTLKLLMFLTKSVTREGPWTLSRQGSLMRKNICTGLAPSMRAASSMSPGMFISTPVAISIWQGTPTQILMRMIITCAQPLLVRKGMQSMLGLSSPMLCSRSVTPIWDIIVLKMPLSPKKLRTSSSVTNWGTAMVITNRVRHSLGNLVFLSLMNMARNTPPKKLVKVAKNAHTSVQTRTLPNAQPKVRDRDCPPPNSVKKLARPTQVNRELGGICC